MRIVINFHMQFHAKFNSNRLVSINFKFIPKNNIAIVETYNQTQLMSIQRGKFKDKQIHIACAVRSIWNSQSVARDATSFLRCVNFNYYAHIWSKALNKNTCVDRLTQRPNTHTHTCDKEVATNENAAPMLKTYYRKHARTLVVDLLKLILARKTPKDFIFSLLKKYSNNKALEIESAFSRKNKKKKNI